MQFPLRVWQELLPVLAGGGVKQLLMAACQAAFGFHILQGHIAVWGWGKSALYL